MVITLHIPNMMTHKVGLKSLPVAGNLVVDAILEGIICELIIRVLS